MPNRTRSEAHTPVSAPLRARRALWRFTGEQPCMVAGPHTETSHSRPHALVCDRHGREWIERTGFCAGWTDEQRLALEARWIVVANMHAEPETLAQARSFVRRGFGRLVRDKAGRPAWVGAVVFAQPTREAV